MTGNKRIIVLGSSGFIGSHLVSWFKSQNYYIVGIDTISRENKALDLHKPDEFFQLVLPDQKFVSILKEIEPDMIINASGPASVGNSVINPEVDFTGSVNLCFFVLETIRKVLPNCRFLFLSSAAVYGNPLSLPIKECSDLAPISPYGFHKMMSENLLKEYSELYGVGTCAVRIFSAYGPGLRKQIFWDICNKVVKNTSVELMGTGKESRDFIYIDDIAYAISIISQKAAFTSEVYNLASGSETTIDDIAKYILIKMYSKKEIKFSFNQRTGDPIRWVADIQKLASLGFSPKVSLDEGINKYIKWVTRELNEK